MEAEALLMVGRRLGEAVVDPSRWPDLMEAICGAADAKGAVLLQTDVRTPDVPRTASIDGSTNTYFAEGWHRRDSRTRCVPRLMQGEPVIIDSDIFAPDEIRRSAFYNECLMPLDVPWFAGVGFRAGSALWAMSIQRDGRQGPFDAADKRILATLAPRLTEAATLSTLVGRRSLLGIVNAFDRLSRPAIGLDRSGIVLDVNGSASALFDDDFRVRGRSLVLSDPSARAKFERFVLDMRATSDLDALAVDPIVVRRARRPPIMMRVAPVDGPARNPFLGARALLVLTDLAAVSPPADGMLNRLFGLSPAEERLARRLATGMSLDEAAETLGVVKQTARNHLKAVFAKTDTHRQAELVALLAKL